MLRMLCTPASMWRQTTGSGYADALFSARFLYESFRMSLSQRAWIGVAALALVIAGLVFGTAGTFAYGEGWAYLAVFSGATSWTTAFLIRSAPELLERRMHGGPFAESRSSQAVIMAFASMGFIAMLVVPGLDYRWHYPLEWTRVSTVIEWIGAALVVVGFYGIFLVFRVNHYAAATIELAADQTVISTGLYGWVRHPMYAAGLLLLLGSPLMLGSWLGVLPVICILPFLIWRSLDEEQMLKGHLNGYSAYCAKVRWRMIPGVF